MFCIEPIHRHLALIPTIAQWHWREWGHADPQGSLAAWTQALQARTRDDAIPTTFVGFAENDDPIGSVVLVECDMSTHADLGPWIAGLFVVSTHRGQGIGAALMRHATAAAVNMGHRELYLHTATSAPLYARLGWTSLFQEHYEGELVDVMHYAVPMPA